MDYKIGSIVRSKAGRDSGDVFAVVKIDEKYVYICDGKERPAQRPKRKNPKHLSCTAYVIDEQHLQTNRKLKKALSEYKAKNQWR